jgi:hypothetical protein
MRRLDPGEWLLLAVVVVLVVITIWILVQSAVQSPELRRTPRPLVTPTVRVGTVPTPTPMPDIFTVETKDRS